MRVLITGGTGFLGTAMQESVPDGVEALPHGWTRGTRRLDVTDQAAVEEAVAGLGANAIVHLAAMSRVADVADDPARAGDVNVRGAEAVARAARATGARLVAVSSDVVFGGRDAPYVETSPTDPINPYGRSKAAGEQAMREGNPAALVVRLSVLVGRDRADRFPFSSYVLDRAAAGLPVELYENELRNFTPVTTAAAALWECVLSGLKGTLHVAATSALSRYEFGRRLLGEAGFDPGLAVASTGPPDRPSDLTLDVALARRTLPTPLPTIDEAITETLRDMGVA